MPDSKQTDASIPTIEILCQSCGGRGFYEGDRDDRCFRCGGTGYIPTDLGVQILDLMRHNFRPMYEDLQGRTGC